MTEAAQKIKTPDTVAPINKPKAKREKSQETILKEKKRSIEKQLGVLDKKITEFEVMEKEVENVESTREKLKTELDAVKEQLIKELGLS